jgi:serine/threonine protein kinase
LEQDVWKIADFGSTAEGTSKGKFSTVYSRGTPSYRAPELLSDTPFYNSKSDVWALGCIFYELAAKKKTFAGDFAVQSYATSPTTFSIPGSRLPSSVKEEMEKLIPQLLSIDYQMRPSALNFQETCLSGNFVRLCLTKLLSTWTSYAPLKVANTETSLLSICYMLLRGLIFHLRNRLPNGL